MKKVDGLNMADFLTANPLGKDKNEFNVSLMF